MSCQCYQIGGPFIEEDPDCPRHGLAAQRENEERDFVILNLHRQIEALTARVDALEAREK